MLLQKPTDAEHYRGKIKLTRCRWCNANLSKERIRMFACPDAWKIPGREETWMLYITCPKCYYDWYLNKLGVKLSI